ncbi:MAG: hypothetical protein JO081_15345 [Alphaproteobacteria bacterium]|nr:hypothetical protein [Alphaproteobacteria bacterium]
MVRRIALMTMMLVVAAGPALAQGGNSPPPQGKSPVIGPTGTMYDGNNADLQLPSEANAWYANRWAGYEPHPQSSWYFGVGDLWYAGRWAGYQPSGSAAAGAARSPAGASTGGGQH